MLSSSRESVFNLPEDNEEANVSGEMQSQPRVEPPASVRTLKIEADGDTWKGLIKPKIRLMGRWLEEAGFKPGLRVQVTCLAPGVIVLRSDDTVASNEQNQQPPERSENPF